MLKQIKLIQEKPSITNLATTTAPNPKINEVKKIPNITNLATKFFHIFLQEYFEIIYYQYQRKNTLNVLVELLGLTRGNLKEFQKKILKNN